MEIDREDLLEVLRYLNTIVVSLDRIGSHAPHISREEGDRITVRFVDQWRVFRMLAEARYLLSKPFSDALGEDNMSELEREMQDVPYWSVTSTKPPPELIKRLRQTRFKRRG